MFNIPPAAVISFKVTVEDGQAHGARAPIMQQLDVVNCHRKPFSGNDSLKNNLQGEKLELCRDEGKKYTYPTYLLILKGRDNWC